MKRSSLIEARRAKVSPDVRRRVDLSFLIVDRIHSILEEKDLNKKTSPTCLARRNPKSANGCEAPTTSRLRQFHQSRMFWVFRFFKLPEFD